MTATFAAVLMWSAAVGAGPNDFAVPPPEKCEEISFFIDHAWMLRVTSDGAGHIQYGSSIMDGGSFPKGTVDFAKLYRSLTPTLVATNHADGQGEARFVAVFFQPWGDRHKAVYARDAGPFEHAFRAGLSGLDPLLANRLDYLLLLYDPFVAPGDRPFGFRPSRTRAEMEAQLQAHVKAPADAYEQLAIYTRSGWELSINPDGSGQLSIGRHPNLIAPLPAKTFDFAQVYDQRVRQPLRDMVQELQSNKRAPSTAGCMTAHAGCHWQLAASANAVGIFPSPRSPPWTAFALADKLPVAPAPAVMRPPPLHRSTAQMRFVIVGLKPRNQPMTLAVPATRDLPAAKALFDHAWQSAKRPKEAAHVNLLPYAMEPLWQKNPPVVVEEEKK
jgi:hypothetical protein